MSGNAGENNGAVEAIRFSLETYDGLAFLELWINGEYAAIRQEWSDVPDGVFPGKHSGGWHGGES